MRPNKIISGGQTGVDRAALDVAIELDIEHGGWCPANRRAEDGTIPMLYNLTEVAGDYTERTRRNVFESDATLAIVMSEASMGLGTRLTRRTALRLRRPFLLLELAQGDIERARRWLAHCAPLVLNVAGSRESGSPGIYTAARHVLRDLLGAR